MTDFLSFFLSQPNLHLSPLLSFLPELELIYLCRTRRLFYQRDYPNVQIKSRIFVRKELPRARSNGAGIIPLITHVHWTNHERSLDFNHRAWVGRISFHKKRFMTEFCRCFLAHHQEMKVTTLMYCRGRILDMDLFLQILRIPATASSLTALDFHTTHLTDEHGARIAQELATNSTLKSVKLVQNILFESSAQAFAQALKRNTTLETLDLSSNLLGCDGAAVLIDALEENKTLTFLSLENNHISSATRSLFRGLQNSTLTSLDLQRNSIGDEGAFAFAEFLLIPSQLQKICLNTNEIGDRSAIRIAEALKKNQTLVSIKLTGNLIRNGGAVAFADALLTNPNSALEYLDLYANLMNIEGLTALWNAIKKIDRTIIVNGVNFPRLF